MNCKSNQTVNFLRILVSTESGMVNNPCKVVIRQKSTTSFRANQPKNSPVHTATRSLAYFFRKGNKEVMESVFRDLIIKRSLKGKIAYSNSSTVTSERQQATVCDLFQSFFLSATPFIGLKTRRKRRGKRVISKLVPLDRSSSERKPFSVLSSILRTSGRATKPFANRLEHELESLYTVTRSRVSGGTVVMSTLREKRDLIHRTAFASMPYR